MVWECWGDLRLECYEPAQGTVHSIVVPLQTAAAAFLHDKQYHARRHDERLATSWKTRRFKEKKRHTSLSFL